MEAILKYDLSDQDQKNALTRALKADQCYYVINSMLMELRSVLKYSEDENEVIQAEKWNNFLRELLIDKDINIESEYT